MKSILWVAVIINLQLCKVFASWGGNDIFTSLNALFRLWQEEQLFVEKLENSIKTFESALDGMKRYGICLA